METHQILNVPFEYCSTTELTQSYSLGRVGCSAYMTNDHKSLYGWACSYMMGRVPRAGEAPAIPSGSPGLLVLAQPRTRLPFTVLQ